MSWDLKSVKLQHNDDRWWVIHRGNGGLLGWVEEEVAAGYTVFKSSVPTVERSLITGSLSTAVQWVINNRLPQLVRQPDGYFALEER